MNEYLKFINNGLWIPVTRSRIKKDDVKIKLEAEKKKKSPKRNLNIKKDKLIADIKNSIEKSGNRSIKIANLFQAFGYSKRSEKNVKEIVDSLHMHSLYITPNLTLELDFNSSVQVYSFPVIQLGKLFETEKELEDYVFRTKAYEKLNIKSVERQFSPKGTKDKLDFKGQDENDFETVIELKNRGGGKTAVEQVLRYAGQLMNQFPDKKVRKILITGIKNYETAMAIFPLNSIEKNNFEWYLYKYDGQNIDFVKINTAELDKDFIKK